MKNTRRFIAGFSALTMAAAMAMSASAVEINQASDSKQGDSKVTYNVDAAYIVTIPAGADMSGDGVDEQTITANNVLLEKGQKITVTLSKASNTASGKSFSAKDKSEESTVKYTIKAGTADVAVGDKVAEFDADGEQALTFTKDANSTPTYAGEHTETLTFDIAVKDAPKTYTSFTKGMVLHVGDRIKPSMEYWESDYYWSFSDRFTYELVRGNVDYINGDNVVTEASDGEYYLFKIIDRNFYLTNGAESFTTDALGKVIFKATSTSDGLIVSNVNGNVYELSVYEP